MNLKNFFNRASQLKRFTQVLVLFSFLVTFALARAVTHLQKAGFLPNQQGDLHIHHLVPGIILIIISGYVGLAYWHHETVRRAMAVLFGVGAALTIDEFALWLYLRDVYWEEEGRNSIDVFIYITTFLVIVLLVGQMWDYLSGRRKPKDPAQ